MELIRLAVKEAALKAMGVGMWQLLAFGAKQIGAVAIATEEATICMIIGLRGIRLQAWQAKGQEKGMFVAQCWRRDHRIFFCVRKCVDLILQLQLKH